MSDISAILDKITDPAAAEAKAQLSQLLTDASEDANAFVQANAAQLVEWLADVNSGAMTQEEFNELVDAQALVAEDFVARQAQATQQKAENLTVNILEMAAKIIVPALIAAI